MVSYGAGAVPSRKALYVLNVRLGTDCEPCCVPNVAESTLTTLEIVGREE